MIMLLLGLGLLIIGVWFLSLYFKARKQAIPFSNYLYPPMKSLETWKSVQQKYAMMFLLDGIIIVLIGVLCIASYFVGDSNPSSVYLLSATTILLLLVTIIMGSQANRYARKLDQDKTFQY